MEEVTNSITRDEIINALWDLQEALRNEESIMYDDNTDEFITEYINKL